MADNKKGLEKIDVVTTLICLAPVIVGALIYNKLPNQIATHFNVNFEPDSFSPKWFALFGLPVFMAVVQFVSCVISKLSGKENVNNKKMMLLVKMIIPILNFVVYFVFVGYALEIIKNVDFIMMGFCAIFFIVIGNYMPKIRQNGVLGVRVSWTLNNEEVWNKTHRFCGKLWVLTGVALFVLSFFDCFMISIILIMLSTVVAPLIYSYEVYKKVTAKEN